MKARGRTSYMHIKYLRERGWREASNGTNQCNEIYRPRVNEPRETANSGAEKPVTVLFVLSDSFPFTSGKTNVMGGFEPKY